MSKPGETDYSKGSFPRTWTTDEFRHNFDQIDWGRKKQGPPYSYGSLGEEVQTYCKCPAYGVDCSPCPCGAQ